VLIGVVLRSINLFHFPTIAYTDDEGIYTAQAWSVLRSGHLTPYTYFYDHAPAGWLFMAIWMGITGGPNTFGGGVQGNRILMVILFAFSVWLLYRIARQLGCNVWLATFAAALFVFSPLGIFYQRLVVLDNIMVPFVLLSITLLLDSNGRLSRFVVSGISFGFALLCKETAAIYLPGMLILLWQQRQAHHRRFSVGAWLLPMILVVSWYPLYALYKSELFPPGFIIRLGPFHLGTELERTSLMGTLIWQLGRGGGGMFNWYNDFWRSLRNEWWPLDPPMLIGAGVVTVLGLLSSIWFRRGLAINVLSFFTILYMMRGGLVFSFYLLASLPFVCLSAGLLVQSIVSKLPNRLTPWLSGALVAVVVFGYSLTFPARDMAITNDSFEAQQEAMAWVYENIPSDSKIIIQDAFYTAFHEPSQPGIQPYRYSYSSVKANFDPAIRVGFFKDDWRNVDYVFVFQAHKDEVMRYNVNSFVYNTISNSTFVKNWTRGSTTLSVWKVNK
jgi:4-amino-4-deoxy-L-arabinose transferase-like glycosyltransferase